MKSFVKELMHSKFTTTTGVNTLFNALNNYPEFAKVDFSHVRFVISGGMALQPAVAERFQQITGVNLAEGYGLTEASPVVSCTPLSSTRYTGTIGLPLSSTDVAIMDEEGKMLPVGREGELCVRGPQVMKGYWQSEAATQKMIIDGWLHTGDVAKLDERGYITIVDRMKNMIIVSGFNVYPNEIEAVVTLMPQVLEVAAIGLPDKHSGERIKLFVVRKDQSLTEQQVIDYCHAELTRYKVPKEIEFRDELPKSNVGKILHRKLREEEERKHHVATQTA
jgi:long-chain acyl-CoA synthetase